MSSPLIMPLCYDTFVREIARNGARCHNKKASIMNWLPIQPATKRFHLSPPCCPGHISSSDQWGENLLRKPPWRIIYNSSWGHRSTKTKNTTGTRAFAWSSSDWLRISLWSAAQMVEETESQLQGSPPLFHTFVLSGASRPSRCRWVGICTTSLISSLAPISCWFTC